MGLGASPPLRGCRFWRAHELEVTHGRAKGGGGTELFAGSQKRGLCAIGILSIYFIIRMKDVLFGANLGFLPRMIGK